MSNRLRLFLILPVVIALLEYFAFTGIQTASIGLSSSVHFILIIAYSLLCAGFWLTIFSIPYIRKQKWKPRKQNFVLIFFTGFLAAKFVIAAPMLVDDFRRLITYLIIRLGHPTGEAIHIPHSVWLARIAILAGLILWVSLFWGIRNQYRYQVRRIKLRFDDLPAAFKGLKIVQISDIHSGSFQDREAVSKGIDLILKEQADLILFTGDLVNNVAKEIVLYKDLFRKLKAPMGVYSILGNHDYGDYVAWPSEDVKKENLETLKRHHAAMGWRLLMNENRVFVRGGDAIVLLGIENWSAKGRFPKYGSLAKAYEGLGPNEPSFKILMSHDPSHWDAEVRTKYPDINLTLSGHTHGMQFGIRLPGGIQWSPIQYFYKQWAGLYKQGKQYLYVNVGFGFLGYPGRLGILPEITVFELL